jgi:hypothetical protein
VATGRLRVSTQLGASLVHVEVGLRNRSRSRPERINRVATGTVSDRLVGRDPDRIVFAALKVIADPPAPRASALWSEQAAG